MFLTCSEELFWMGQRTASITTRIETAVLNILEILKLCQRTASITTRIETPWLVCSWVDIQMSENSIHYNKDWDFLFYSGILLLTCQRTASITTRIETLSPLHSQSSCQASENSIHYNKDWDLLKVIDVTFKGVREQHPLQQGLRLLRSGEVTLS